VEVYFDPGDPPARCRPYSISLRLRDVGDDVLSPVSKQMRLRGGGEHKVTIGIPEFFESTPDEASANTVMRRGRSSPVARVRITRPSS
jgi:hypothetical protein